MNSWEWEAVWMPGRIETHFLPPPASSPPAWPPCASQAGPRATGRGVSAASILTRPCWAPACRGEGCSAWRVREACCRQAGPVTTSPQSSQAGVVLRGFPSTWVLEPAARSPCWLLSLVGGKVTPQLGNRKSYCTVGKAIAGGRAGIPREMLRTPALASWSSGTLGFRNMESQPEPRPDREEMRSWPLYLWAVSLQAGASCPGAGPQGSPRVTTGVTGRGGL